MKAGRSQDLLIVVGGHQLRDRTATLGHQDLMSALHGPEHSREPGAQPRDRHLIPCHVQTVHFLGVRPQLAQPTPTWRRPRSPGWTRIAGSAHQAALLLDPCTDKAVPHHVRKARPVRAEAMRVHPATEGTLNPVLLELAPERALADPELVRGCHLVVVGFGEGVEDHATFELVERVLER